MPRSPETGVTIWCEVIVTRSDRGYVLEKWGSKVNLGQWIMYLDSLES